MFDQNEVYFTSTEAQQLLTKSVVGHDSDFARLKETLSYMLCTKTSRTLWSKVEAHWAQAQAQAEAQTTTKTQSSMQPLGEYVFAGQDHDSDLPPRSFVVRLEQRHIKSKPCTMLHLVDVTSAKQAERELSAKQYRNILLTTASHELNTPLNGILGGVQLIEQSTSLSEVLEYCKIVRGSCKQLQNLTNSMQDYCLYESKSLVLNYESVALHDMLSEALDLIATQTQQRKVHVSLNYDPVIPTAILTDKKRLMQILSSVLFNAAKYTFKGSITLSAKFRPPMVQIEVVDTGIGISKRRMRSLFKLFADVDAGEIGPRHPMGTGAGISSGLGLAFSQTLASLLGTGIQVSSAENVGTKVSFAIFQEPPAPRRRVSTNDGKAPGRRNPKAFAKMATAELTDKRARNPHPEPYTETQRQRSIKLCQQHGAQHASDFEDIDSMDASIAEECSDRAPRKRLSSYHLIVKKRLTADSFGLLAPSSCLCPDILIVDDNAFNLLVLKSLLSKMGFKVQEATNGQDCITKVVEIHKHDCGTLQLIMMDCEMPIKTGYDATQELVAMMAQGKIMQVPIIACTSYTGEEQRHRCQESGMVGFLNKPIVLTELQNILQELNIHSHNFLSYSS